jgi:uncharacterized protein
MDCPRCQKPLIILEFERVEIDYCASCQGVWLDSGELELLLESSHEKHLEFQPDKTAQERPFKCPRCHKRMNKVRGGNDKAVLLDSCKNGHGLWFDGGELEIILKDEKIDSNNRIFKHLRGIFVKKSKTLNTGDAK